MRSNELEEQVLEEQASRLLVEYAKSQGVPLASLGVLSRWRWRTIRKREVTFSELRGRG